MSAFSQEVTNLKGHKYLKCFSSTKFVIFNCLPEQSDQSSDQSVQNKSIQDYQTKPSTVKPSKQIVGQTLPSEKTDIDFEADIMCDITAAGDFIILDVAMKLIPIPIFRSGRSSTSLLPGWLMIFLGAIWAPIIPWMEQLKASTLMEQSHWHPRTCTQCTLGHTWVHSSTIGHTWVH